MIKIQEKILRIVDMLRQSSKYSKADWLEKRLNEIESGTRDTEDVIRDIKSIIAGMGSLSDLYLKVNSDLKGIDESKYNLEYITLVEELDFEINRYLRSK